MRGVVAAAAALGVLLVYQGITFPHRSDRPGLVAALDRITAEAGYDRLSGRGLLVMSLGGAFLSLVVVSGVTPSLAVALAFALGAASLPLSWVRSRRVKRRRRFREAWPDAIAGLISGVRAGVSLPEACASLGERGPVDLRLGFSSLALTYRSSGSFKAGLESMRAHLADPIADRVVAALTIAHDVGGTELVRVLRALGNFVRDDLRVRKEIEARWSWTVTAARVAAAAPWIVLLLMSMRPEAARAYNSPAGVAVIAAGGAATFVGYRLMLRAGRLPEEPRLEL
jgi:tight adherence protein B